MLNPALDKAALRKKFRRDRRIRIQNFLKPEIAARIQKCFQDETIPFNLNYVQSGQNRSNSPAEIASYSVAQKQLLDQEIAESAAKGVGFLYCGYRMGQGKPLASTELVFLHEVFEFFNSDKLLNLVRDITGTRDIKAADAQYTRYTPGQFLTRHRDILPGEDRRFAYVLGFSEAWHPDWGGLLQFYKEDGTPRNAWMPQFNTLSLFDTKHIHSVTYVTPFAKHQRISLTGWFLG